MSIANFPKNFLSNLAGSPGFESENFTKAHDLSASPTSIRLNPFKKPAVQYSNKVPWCSDGYYLDSRPSFTFDPLFHAGCYYVQEASSMFIDHILQHIHK